MKQKLIAFPINIFAAKTTLDVVQDVYIITY